MPEVACGSRRALLLVDETDRSLGAVGHGRFGRPQQIAFGEFHQYNAMPDLVGIENVRAEGIAASVSRAKLVVDHHSHPAQANWKPGGGSWTARLTPGSSPANMGVRAKPAEVSANMIREHIQMIGVDSSSRGDAIAGVTEGEGRRDRRRGPGLAVTA